MFVIRHFSWIVISAFLALSVPALAQTAEKPKADHLRTLIRTDPMTIEIAEDKKSDLNSCDASEGEALITALHNCWPILQAFQKYSANKKAATDAALAIGKKVRAGEVERGSDAHEKMKAQAKAANFKAAQELYDMTKARKYPLQDMPLFLSNLTRIALSSVTGDYKTALPYLEENIHIMETTKVTEPGFALLEPLREQRKLFLEYIAEQNASENQ